MLPNIGATECISHTLLSHLGVDVVGELDSAFDIVHLPCSLNRVTYTTLDTTW